MKLENSNLEIIKLTQSFICHHLANKPHYWLDFALWRLGHPFSDLLRKVGLLTKDRMLSIYKNDFTTFTQPKNPFVIFKKPGADNAEDLIYTDKKSICNRDFLRSSDLTTPWSVSFVRRKPLQCHLKLVYTSLSRQLRPVSLCKRTLDTTIRKYSDPSHYTLYLGRQSCFFLKFVDCVRLWSVVILKAIPFKTIKPGLGRLFYWNTS